VAVALTKVIGHEGSGKAHAEQSEVFDTVDAKHVDLTCLDHAGIQVQGAPLKEELIGLDHPLVRPITAVVHDAQALVLLAGIPEIVQDRGVAAKTILQYHVVECSLQEGADLGGGVADDFVQGRDGLVGEGVVAG
jgi:hypothetical protein